jgi:hypothetical protein
MGAFAEMSSGTYAIIGLISSVLANKHCSFSDDKPSEAEGMFIQRLYRSLGLAVHLGWARFLVDRYRNLVEIPAPTREGPGDGRHHFAQPLTTKARSSTRTITALTTPISVVGGLCFDARFSQLIAEPEPPSGVGRKKKTRRHGKRGGQGSMMLMSCHFDSS